MNVRAIHVITAALLACLLVGCSLGGATDAPSTTSSRPSKEVVLVTHDSWAAPGAVLRQFTERTGYVVKQERAGDAGALTNRLVLTKSSPIGDVVFGIDNTFASRAVDEGILAAYTPKQMPESADAFTLPGTAGGFLTPVDFGDVCVNIDTAWFRQQRIRPPATLDDLVDPTYADLFVTPGASTSSPGLAFLLATVAAFGESGWKDYWSALMRNGAKIVPGWTDAYQVDFTGGGQGGDRPIVLSYASSPPFTIPQGATRPTTRALLDTCFRQVEYAGVVAGAENPEGAKAFVDFLLTKDFQKVLPESMYVFPVDDSAALPSLWSRWARTADEPFSVAPKDIALHRDEWLRDWGDVTSR